MKRRGPPNGSGPRSEKRMRVAGERSHNRSDTRRASLKPLSSKSSSDSMEPENLLDGPAQQIVLRSRGRSRFDVLLGDKQIVTSNGQPICDAARVLHELGFSDDRRLTVWHEGADYHAISGQLGFWRKRRVREDRGLPRYVGWEPRPRPVGAKKGDGKFKAASHGAGTENASVLAPGANQRDSPAAEPLPSPPTTRDTQGGGGTA
jgi:hypothetical protein